MANKTKIHHKIKKQEMESEPEWKKMLDKEQFDYVLIITQGNRISIMGKPGDDIDFINSKLETAKNLVRKKIDVIYGIR